MYDQIIQFLAKVIGFLGSALVPLAVLFTFALARRYMSAAKMKPPEQQYSEEDGKFGSRYWIVQICIVVVGTLFALSTHAAFVWLNRYICTAEGPSDFQLWPQSAIWWFFPGFGALTLSWQIVLQLWSDFGNRKAAYSFNYCWAQTAGFDSTRILQWMALFIALPVGVLTVLALPMHASLRQDDIRDCGYAFAPCKVYRFADARRMTLIDGFRDRQGKLTRRAGIVIDFKDGRRWSSADIGNFSDSVDPEFAEFLEKKTQLPLNHAQTEADIPRLNSRPQPQSQ
jgi:hypothetical protein